MLRTFIPARTDDAVAFLVDRAQAAVDEQALAEWERAELFERSVTFDDVLEEMGALTDSERREFMVSLARATRGDANAVFVTIVAAKERIVARRLDKGV